MGGANICPRLISWEGGGGIPILGGAPIALCGGAPLIGGPEGGPGGRAPAIGGPEGGIPDMELGTPAPPAGWLYMLFGGIPGPKQKYVFYFLSRNYNACYIIKEFSS